MKIPLPGRSTALSEPILRELLSCCASTLHKDLVNTFDRSCRTTSSASPSDSLVSLQTAPKFFAKEQDAARQTHASPSYGLTAGNGLPKDAVFFFFWVTGEPATRFQAHSASGRQLIQDAQTGQLHTNTPHPQLLKTRSETVYNPSPLQVISWDPSRLWRSPTHPSAR